MQVAPEVRVAVSVLSLMIPWILAVMRVASISMNLFQYYASHLYDFYSIQKIKFASYVCLGLFSSTKYNSAFLNTF